MKCDQCKNCFNYLICELGCFGVNKPCEHLQTDTKDLVKELIPNEL